MSHLLEILGRGLLSELSAAFRELLQDDAVETTPQLERRVQANPDSERHHQRLAVRHLVERTFGKAREEFTRALNLDSESVTSRLGLACALDELGLTRAAVEQLQAVVQRDPDNGPAWFALGFCQEKLGDPDEAIVCYERTVDVSANLRNAHERLAAIYLKLDQIKPAIVHYQTLCHAEPGDVQSMLSLAGLYLRDERFEDAIQCYQSALIFDPDNWDAQDDLIAACADGGRPEQALQLLNGLIARRPECADLHIRLGNLYSRLGQEVPARDAYARALQLNPDYLEAAVKLGTLCLRRGEYSDAAQIFGRAIEINDRVVGGYVGLAVAQRAAGREEEALAALEVAAGIEPNSTLLFSEMARLQLLVSAAQQQERYLNVRRITAQPVAPVCNEAQAVLDTQIGRCRDLLQRHPDHADLYYRLGLLLRQAGDLAAAIDAFQHAVSINPRYFKAQVKLGLGLREAGRMPEAAEVFQSALELDPESTDLHYQLGLIYADRGQFELALERFEQATRQAPGTADYVANLALALQNLGLLDRASATWQSLLELVEGQPSEKEPFLKRSL